ncbi:MAG: PQQ-dependent sugar dehydrogenase, partial [Bacteroidota bacterium]|nr:PQQ-dependent sugar dehydrogenase [Bacteroidota bacterium]
MFSLTAQSRILSFLFRFLIFAFILSSPLAGIGQGNEFNSVGTVSLTSVISCTVPTSGNPSYTLNNATPSAGVPSGCVSGGNGNHYDVWFSFTALNTIETVTIGNLGGNISKPEVQIFSGTAYANFVSKGCGTTTATATGLTINTTYFIRVSNVGADPTGNGQSPKFDICLTHPVPPPSNDDCSGAIILTSGTTNNSGTVWNATASSGIPVGCATGDPDDDVWYTITTSTFSNSLTVNLPSIGTDLNASGVRIQVFTGGCGSLASYACGSISLTTAVSGNTTYYIRVYSAVTGALASSGGSTFSINATVSGPTVVTGGRNNELFKQTILSGSGVLQYPWEITYGPDDNLWITEARGYKVYRMNPNTGVKTTILDLNSASTDLTAFGADSLRAVNLTSTSNWNATANNWPQGGLAGLAIHPNFGDGTGRDYVYISYVHRYLSTASGSAGIFFRNKIVRFIYNSVTGKLGSPAVVCDTIPGGQDHNSQRMIIAPVTAGGTNYLFYAGGDMGAGQFANRLRPQNAQNIDSYEGKILRFNLEPDSDGDSTVPNAWIPNGNPYNALLGKQSAVYSIGFRNNQGFAYDTLTNKLYGSSHGPYTDDEINIIEGFRNYGHPLIEGFVDGNYNGNSASGTNTSVSAGAPYTDNLGVSSCPPIGNEATNRATIDASGKWLYKDPLFSAYAAPAATVLNIWQTNPGNANPAPGWPTEAWSGLDLYSNNLIPGWKRSLVAASLKWGRLVRLKLSADGSATAPTNTVAD